MILYQLAGLVEGSALEVRSLLDVAIESKKCGMVLSSSDLLALSPEESSALCLAYDILAGLSSYPVGDDSEERADHALSDVLRGAREGLE